MAEVPRKRASGSSHSSKKTTFISGLTREARPYALRIEAACRRRRDQHVAVGEIAAFGEIAVHQPLLHICCMTYFAGPQDQPVAIERIGLALDVIEVVAQPLRRDRLRDALRDGAIALG